jgi:hypothetical protein
VGEGQPDDACSNNNDGLLDGHYVLLDAVTVVAVKYAFRGLYLSADDVAEASAERPIHQCAGVHKRRGRKCEVSTRRKRSVNTYIPDLELSPATTK